MNNGDWFTSSFSNGAGGACVEVRINLDGTLVRDSKDRRPAQPTIGLPSQGWRLFLAHVSEPSR